MRKFRKLFAAIMAAALMMALCVVGASAEEYTFVNPQTSELTGERLYQEVQNENFYYKNGGSDYTLFTAQENSDGTYTFKTTSNDSFMLGKEQTLANKANTSGFWFSPSLYLGSKVLPTDTEEPTNPEVPSNDAVKITKNIKVAEGVTIPDNTKFTYTIAPDTTVSNNYAQEVSLTADDIVYTDVKDDKTETKTINIDAIKTASRTHGAYVYKITENTVSDGWTKDPTVYILYVNKDTAGNVTAQIQKQGESEKSNEAVFENTYNKSVNLTVSKKVSNDSLVADGEFEVTITLNQPTEGNQIPAVGVKATVGTTEYTFKAGEGTKVTLKNGESVVINDLPAGTTYKVEETNSKNAKSVSYKVNDTTESQTAPVGKLDTNTTVTITNNFDQSETGLATRIAPFVAMAVLAGGAVAAYFVVARKRQENE